MKNFNDFCSLTEKLDRNTTVPVYRESANVLRFDVGDDEYLIEFGISKTLGHMVVSFRKKDNGRWVYDANATVNDPVTARKVLATVMFNIADRANKQKTYIIKFSAHKDVGSRKKLYDRMVKVYSKGFGYDFKIEDNDYILTNDKYEPALPKIGDPYTSVSNLNIDYGVIEKISFNSDKTEAVVLLVNKEKEYSVTSIFKTSLWKDHLSFEYQLEDDDDPEYFFNEIKNNM